MKTSFKFIFLALLFVTASANASETWEQYLEKMALRDAIRLTGRTPSGPLPKVLFVNHKTFCKADKKACAQGASGVYNVETNKIHIDTDSVNIITVEGQSVVVHEFVHFLQRMTVYSMDECFMIEDEAYVTQRKWLKEKGGRIEFAGSTDGSCKREDYSPEREMPNSSK